MSGVDILSATHLVQYQGAGSSPKDLTMDVNLEDASPAFSPDGSRLAFARRFLDIGRWTPGRQLWVMTINTGNVKQLTQVPFYSHYDFTWSLDSQHLAYARFKELREEVPELRRGLDRGGCDRTAARHRSAGRA